MVITLILENIARFICFSCLFFPRKMIMFKPKQVFSLKSTKSRRQKTTFFKLGFPMCNPFFREKICYDLK